MVARDSLRTFNIARPIFHVPIRTTTVPQYIRACETVKLIKTSAQQAAEEEAMMHAVRVSSPLLASTFMSSPVIQRDRTSSCGLSLASEPHSLTVCQLETSKSSVLSSESTRRTLMIATMTSLTGAAAAGFITKPDSAHAAKRKPPPPPEEKKDNDEKYLSAYDAKVLANIRRKEALKAQLETQKAKAKIVREPAQPPPDMFGQVSESQVPESRVLEGQVSE